ncbi:hypothetical protein ACIHQR_08725 [Corallococcus coralloides]|uniref:hypothetical protein n=1 Tax=Corallococcus coralloides TaxID=184914 RepID=UPI00384FC40E
MSPSLANFLFETVNFLLLAVALGWLLFKPVRRALDAERERHARTEEEARRLREEAEVLARASHEARDAAGREGDARRRELLASARQEAARVVEAARVTQAADRQRLAQELSAWRESQAAELSETVGRITAESVRALLGALDGPSLDLALIRAARAELDSVPAEARGAALVECARPLDAEARALLAGVLGDGVKARVVGELGAGVRVTTPAGQVDATALSVARQAALAVKRSMDGARAGAGGQDG